MTDPAISVTNVTRRFGSTVAVDDLSFDVPKGSIFGLIGTNGAGKTTLIRMLVGHLHCDSGSVHVLGSEPWSHDTDTRRRVAYVSDQMQLPRDLTLSNVLAMNAGFFPKWNADVAASLAEEFKVWANKKYRELSFGQQRRAVLAQALAQGADVLILDEPASGLDPRGRRQFLDTLLSAAVDGGQTVLFSSHMLTDVERVVDRVAVIADGQLRITSDLESLKSRLRRLRIDGTVDVDEIKSRFTVLEHRVSNGVTELLVDAFDDAEWQEFSGRLKNAVMVETLNLEEMFLELTADC